MKSEKIEEVEKKGKEISKWIEETLKEELPKHNLRESLLDGVILCKLVNALAPGALKRFHKKPRMLAMKIENIGFFLATCKTRFNLPPALLFQPTDIHDDSNNLNSMSKVLNVLSFLKGDGEGGMIAGLEDDEEEEEGDTTPAHKPEEPEPVVGVESPEIIIPDEHKNSSISAGREPSLSHKDNSSTSIASTASPASTASTASPLSTTHSELSSTEFADIQTEVLKIISEAINQELSIETKRKLVKILQQQIFSFEEKLMRSSDAELTSLLNSVAHDESQKVNSRKGAVDALILYSRIQ